ncbi:M48 family metallopeptidase [Mycoplasma aquilae ATCC BAA-1896]|uniref:M48 family metallopeptidase n=1 Tax=Mycoplasma aquilae TaxID=1312741 RepID=UPI003A8A3A88
MNYSTLTDFKLATITINNHPFSYYCYEVKDRLIYKSFINNDKIYIIYNPSIPKLQDKLLKTLKFYIPKLKYELSPNYDTFYFIGKQYQYKYKSIGLILLVEVNNPSNVLASIPCSQGKEQDFQYIVKCIIKHLNKLFYDYMQNITNHVTQAFKRGPIDIQIVNNITSYHGQYTYNKITNNELIKYNLKSSIAAPNFLLYIAIHEVAHSLSHGNDKHSQKFWSAVSLLLPNYKEYKNKYIFDFISTKH